jgi:hypothetical protein
LVTDLKKVLHILPDGIMIYKINENKNIKLWNKEFENKFLAQKF